MLNLEVEVPVREEEHISPVSNLDTKSKEHKQCGGEEDLVFVTKDCTGDRVKQKERLLHSVLHYGQETAPGG